MLIFRSDSKGNYERNIKVLWNTCGSSCNLWPKQDIKVKKEEIINFFTFFILKKFKKIAILKKRCQILIKNTVDVCFMLVQIIYDNNETLKKFFVSEL